AWPVIGLITVNALLAVPATNCPSVRSWVSSSITAHALPTPSGRQVAPCRQLPQIGQRDIGLGGLCGRRGREPCCTQPQRLGSSDIVVEIVTNEHCLLRTRSNASERRAIELRMRLEPTQLARDDNRTKVTAQPQTFKRPIDDRRVRIVGDDGKPHMTGQFLNDFVSP